VEKQDGTGLLVEFHSSRFEYRQTSLELGILLSFFFPHYFVRLVATPQVASPNDRTHLVSWASWYRIRRRFS